MPLEGDALPHSKGAALVRGEKRYRRKVASPKRWQAIADEKQGPCRCCLAPPPNQLHHVLSRGARGGSDVADNIVPVCSFCHDRIEQRWEQHCRALIESLTDAEYSYAVHNGGEQIWEARYGVTYTRAAA